MSKRSKTTITESETVTVTKKVTTTTTRVMPEQPGPDTYRQETDVRSPDNSRSDLHLG